MNLIFRRQPFDGSAESVSSGPDGHALTEPSKICSDTAATPRIRWAIWFSTSADIAMPSGRHFPISPARRCNWRISGRTSATIIAKGRIYLPLEDLHRYGVSEDDIATARNTSAFCEMMRFEVQRAREWFERGLPLVGRVDRELALDLELFSHGQACCQALRDFALHPRAIAQRGHQYSRTPQERTHVLDPSGDVDER